MLAFFRSATLAALFYLALVAWNPAVSNHHDADDSVRAPESNSQMMRDRSINSDDKAEDDEPDIYTV
jgi:hypothetical protein